MLSRKLTTAFIVGMSLFFGICQAQAQLFRKKPILSAPDTVVMSDDNNFEKCIGPDPKYGYDPHFVYNPYPWHTPTMYSGFRHYHLPPPVESPEIDASEEGVFPGHDNEQDPRTAVITVKVPETADVWIFGRKTKQGGTLRQFVTPPLENGQNAWYEIKASWIDGEKKVEQTRRVN